MRNNIREQRKKAELTQSRLAKKIEVPQTTIAKYENETLKIENMTLKMAYSIATACNCKIEDLFKEEKTMETKTIYVVRGYATTIKNNDFEYTEGCSIEYDLSKMRDIYYDELLRTENKEEALTELAKHKSFAKENGFNKGEWNVHEYFIDAENYDEDGDFFDTMGTIAFAECEIIPASEE